MQLNTSIGADAQLVPNAPQYPDRLLRLDQVKEIVGLGKTLIYRLIGEGEFPIPYKPGGSATRWSENEVHRWLSSCSRLRLQ
jgi:prophage regulatory protein